MPSNQTPNYQLNQWEASDQVCRTDFNADNAKIDAALAQKAAQSDLSALAELVGTPLRAKWGSYTGTGTNDHTIEMGLRPVFAMIFPSGVTYSYLIFLGNHGMHYNSSGNAFTTLNHAGTAGSYYMVPTNQGLHMHCDGGDLSTATAYIGNGKNGTYYWFALGY